MCFGPQDYFKLFKIWIWRILYQLPILEHIIVVTDIIYLLS